MLYTICQDLSNSLWPKKYEHPATSEPELNVKWSYFVGVLERMKAKQQPLCDDTMEDYSRAWCEYIDRGGLCKVKP